MKKVNTYTVRAALLAVAILGPVSVRAQKPTEAQAKRAMQDPAIAARVKARLAASGMTPEQIRARLKAAGYSESLLDTYLGATSDTGATAPPAADVMKAVAVLGLGEGLDTIPSITGMIDTARVPLLDTTLVTIAPRAGGQSRIYGLDIFRRATSQFQADMAGPVDASYKLGPRDVLAVILTGGVENSYTLEVTREGFVVIPQVGQIYVANLTLDQVTDLLYRRMRAVYSGLGRGANSSTQLFVTVARLRTNQVFVVGDVMTPGSYQVSSAGTMLTALYAAGGPSDNGSLRQIQLRRGGKVIGTMDLYAYLERGDASNDLRMETGDVLFAPVHGPRVDVSGAVVRPAIYEVTSTETLNDVLRLAGGFRAEASQRRVLISRILPPEQRVQGGRDRTVLEVTSEQIQKDGGAGVRLADGDQVEVFEIAPKVRNRVLVEGAVWQPGNQGYIAGMKLSDALRNAGGVRPEVKDVLIERLQTDQSRLQLRAAFRDTLGALVNDLPLQEDDIIRVYSTSGFRPQRYVAITGAVRKPGRFPWREGMTLRDLVHDADGLADGAYLKEAEVARLPENRSAGALALTIKAPLDSTYLLERNLNGKYNGPPGLSAASGGAAPVLLMPYDNVLILRQPDWSLERTVEIRGEVKFPGEYALRSKSERIADLVERAGGLTATAYADGAVFERSQGGIGRISIDLNRALKDRSDRDNLALESNDKISIPTYHPVVDVRGAVNSPIAVAYRPGKDINYYLDAAGGLAYNGDKDRAYVQQPSGIREPYRSRAFFLPDSKPEPQPGSVVVVPTTDPNDKKDWTAIIGSVAQVTASLIAIIAIARR